MSFKWETRSFILCFLETACQTHSPQLWTVYINTPKPNVCTQQLNWAHNGNRMASKGSGKNRYPLQLNSLQVFLKNHTPWHSLQTVASQVTLKGNPVNTEVGEKSRKCIAQGIHPAGEMEFQELSGARELLPSTRGHSQNVQNFLGKSWTSLPPQF